MTKDKAVYELAVLEERLSNGEGWTDGDYVEALQMAQDALEAQDEMRWVPCTTWRLPKEYKEVLVCEANGVIEIAHWWGCKIPDDGEVIWSSESGHVDVIAWMPLPEPYTQTCP